PGSPPVALRAPSGEPGATPLPFDSFRIPQLLFQTRFNPKFVSRKIGGGSLRYPGIPWGKVYAMRIVLAHKYFKIDPDIVWDTIQKSLPELEMRIREIQGDLRAARTPAVNPDSES
ncbi:MAG: DUF86 domain-containing protein, partial [Betaproteobacteria bacterium]|nr:DUF86 domain-containing protein [Betaproteobacteria bacterium]